jgi:ElaB/YqjD/DUF883 family membrane-anchored ribosome-binding protein
MEGARVKENVQQATRSMQENLAEGVGRMQDRVQENVRRGVEQTRSMLASFNDQFGSFVQESPVLAIGGAFAVGYLVAKVARAFK